MDEIFMKSIEPFEAMNFVEYPDDRWAPVVDNTVVQADHLRLPLGFFSFGNHR